MKDLLQNFESDVGILDFRITLGYPMMCVVNFQKYFHFMFAVFEYRPGSWLSGKEETKQALMLPPPPATSNQEPQSENKKMKKEKIKTEKYKKKHTQTLQELGQLPYTCYLESQV